MSVRNQINALVARFLTRISRTLIILGFTLENRHLSVISSDDILQISKIISVKQSGSRRRAREIARKQSLAHELWQDGFVHDSIEIAKEVQREIYRNFDLLDSPKYFPKFMSTYWTNMIGHFAFLGIHVEGQKRGHLPFGKRHIFDTNENSNRELLDCFQNDFTITRIESTRDWSELSGFWPDLERLHLIKTTDDFEHIYKLWEIIWREKRLENPNEPILTLADEYISNSENALYELGINPEESIVGIHIRESATPNHLRSQPIETYMNSISYLIQKGFKVVRLGNPSMTKIPSITGLIDLSRDHEDKKLHAYILANSKFFISTTSGPGSIPMLFNVPTLHTNVTSLSKNVLLQNKGSIYLPKTILNSKNQVMSYSQILQSPIGYSERNIYKKSAFNVLPNSSEEIFEGVKEMLQFLTTKKESIPNHSDSLIVDQLRDTFKPLGNGKIAASYLDKNRKWFLNA